MVSNKAVDPLSIGMNEHYYDKFFYVKPNPDDDVKNLHPAKIRVNKFYKSLICPEPGKKLLDIGCGTGVYLSMLEETGADLWGIDISKNAVEIAKRNIAKSNQIICENANPLPFNDNEFDYVTAWGVIEHFPSTSSILSEIKRVLKFNGKTAIMVPNVYYYIFISETLLRGSGPVKHQKIEFLYCFKEWKDLIEKAGLSVLETHRHNKFNKPMSIWLRNILVPFYFSNHFVFICTK